MIKVVDRYVGRAAILGTLVVWSAMMLLFSMINLLDELRSTQGDYGTADAFWFTALTMPSMAYQVFPVSALLGSLVGVGGLAAVNELVAFRTAGASRVRLALAAIFGVLLITIPVVIMGEWFAPASEQQARAYRLSEKVGQAIIGGPRGMWLRDGEDIVNIQRPLLSADRGEQSVEFKNVVIYNFSEDVDLESITRAGNAQHQDGRWTLVGVETVYLGESGARLTRTDRLLWPTEVKPDLLDSAVTRPSLLSVRSLLEYLDYLGENGLNDRVYKAALWEKLIYPFTVIALVLAGMPFVFGAARSQNMGVRLFFGMMLGGTFMIVDRAVQKFGGVYDLPAVLTLVAPPLVLMLVAIFILRRSV